MDNRGEAGCIISTVDGDSDGLRGAVCGCECVGIGEGVTSIEGIDGGVGVVEDVGPGAGGEGIGAVTVIARGLG